MLIFQYGPDSRFITKTRDTVYVQIYPNDIRFTIPYELMKKKKKKSCRSLLNSKKKCALFNVEYFEN